MTTPAEYTLLRLPEVLRLRGRSKASHYADIKAGMFPPPVNLGSHCVGWPEAEVIAVNAARIAGRSDAEVCGLVRDLVVRRRSIA